MSLESESNWHFDKRIPVISIAALFMQTAAVVWFIAQMDSRVSRLEDYSAQYREIPERVIRVETRLAATNEAVIAMGEAVLANTQRIASTEGNHFTASDGVALEARVNDRIDDSFDRLQELISLLREDVRALRVDRANEAERPQGRHQ